MYLQFTCTDFAFVFATKAVDGDKMVKQANQIPGVKMGFLIRPSCPISAIKFPVAGEQFFIIVYGYSYHLYFSADTPNILLFFLDPSRSLKIVVVFFYRPSTYAHY